MTKKVQKFQNIKKSTHSNKRSDNFYSKKSIYLFKNINQIDHFQCNVKILLFFSSFAHCDS